MKQYLNRLSTNPRYYFFVVIYLCWTIIITTVGFGRLPYGVRLFTNRESSMLPLISPNSLTVVIPQPYYEVGDVVSYYQQIEGQEHIITHRIYQLGGNVYITKGDYNQAIDSEIVVPRHVIGRVQLIIPYLGTIFSLVKTLPGTILLLILPAALIITTETIRFRNS